MNHEEIIKVADRLERLKDMDPDYTRILNDAHGAIIQLLTDLSTARSLYNKALEDVHNNLADSENK